MLKTLRNIFSKEIVQPERKSTVIPLTSGSFLEFAFSGYGRVSADKAFNFYQNNSTVATAVDKIAKAVEQIKPVIKLSNGDILNTHPALDLLNNPNSFETYQEWMGKLCRHYLLTHDSHIVALGNINRPPLELYAVKPQLVFPMQAEDGYASSYNVTTGMGAGEYSRTEINRFIHFYSGNLKEIYHIMGFSSRRDDVYGDSPLEAAALETKQQIQGRYHNLSLLKNGGRLSMVVTFNDGDVITADEHKERKQRINEDLGGPSSAGKIAVISGADMIVTELGKSNKDMDYAELDNVAGKAIYQRYNIPLPLISTDASTYNNVENALFDFYENTVLPTICTLFSGISKLLLPRYKMQNVMISYDPESIKVIIRRTLEEMELRKKISVETINELRSLLPGREDIDGGDVLYQPANLVQIGIDPLEDRISD